MDLDAFDHESHMREALDAAREAAARGDEPFGSVLVKDDEVVMRAGNRIVSENDLRAHPELTLAKRAAAERDDADELVMYTSTEPCPMCAGGIDIAGLRAVVYSVSGERAAALHGSDALLSSTAVFEAGRGDVRVIPDVLRAEGEKLHEAHR
ncbi:nucleoside deaminase [Halolamina rubra]|uniref:nucleoside deaminase n=1 Tax=Halolamina rubra TaxID=1380430 RepID=UPI0006790CFF|nr:deaminase [Halolamina rubra]